MPNKIDALYSEVSKSYEVGSIDDFKKYLADPKKRQLFFKEIIAPEYDVKSIDDFDEAYGFKKKSTESPGQGAQKDIFSVSGETPKAGPSEPSARKRYDVTGQKVEPAQPKKSVAQLTQKDLDMMMPFMGTPEQTNVLGDVPAEQQNPFAENVNRAASILRKKSPEGDAFTAGIIKNKPESKAYAKEVLATVEGPETPSYIEKVVNSSTAAGVLANKIAASETMSNLDDTDFEEIAGLNKQLQDNAIEEEEGVVGFIKYLPTVVMQSAGSMIVAAPSGLAAGAVGAGVGSVVPGLGTAAGAAAGFASGTSLALEYSSSLMGSLRDAGVDITDADQLKAAFNSPEKMSEAKSYALKRGIPVAIFDAISGGIAGKFFKPVAGATAKQVMKAGAKEVAIQAALGGAGEASAQAIADGKLDARQIAYEMVAEPVTSLPSSAINYLGSKAKTLAEKKYVERLATDADLKVKSDIAMVVNPEIAASTKKINDYRKLKEEAVSQTAKDEYDRIIAQEREKKYTAYDKFFPEFDGMSEEKKQAAYTLLEDINKTMAEYNAAESPAEKKILGQVLSNKVKQLKGDAVQEQATSEVPVQSGAQSGQEVVEGKPQPEPQVVAEEGAAKEEVTQYIADLQETKQSDPEQYWSVDSVTEEAAKEGTVITDEDGGVVVSKDGDIKGLFKKAASKAKGVAQKLLQKAVEAGGVKLDNFDNYLTPVYEKAGFRVVSRVPFNEEYAPEGWNKEKHGTPDVVAMVYDPQNKLDIQEQKFENYDEAMAYRDQLVEQSKTEYPMQSNFDQALNKSAQALNVVAPGLKVIVGENVDDVQNRIVEAIAPLIGERQAVKTAEEFATGTKGQTIFVDGKPFAVVFDKTTADSRTAGHEAWEVMLNDAFGNDQAKFKEFTAGIDSQLRAQGFGDIADKLDAFASQKGYEAVKYSEYMAELGGMLVEAGFGKGPLTAQQKTLLQKIGDIINKFAELFTGKKQFLDQASPEDILGFMVTISDKVAKGEDVSSLFRKGEKAKSTEGVTSRKQAEKIFTGEEKVPTFKSLPEIANWLEGWSKKNKIFAKDIKDVSDQEFVKKLESHTLKELAAWDGVRGQDYVSFYVGDIVDRLNPKLQKFAEARYGRMLTPGEVTLYHAVSGFASPQADPMFDSSKGLEIFDKYMNGGNPDVNKLSGYADKQATIYELNDKGKKVDTGKLKFDKEGNPVYSQVSMHYAVPSLNKMKAMISHFDGDVEKAMEWMTSIHSYEEISEVMGTPLKGSKALTPHENLSKEDGGFGIFGFTGAKLGSYILNRIGEYSTITKDMWYARTMARLVGEPLTKDGKAMTDPWSAGTVAGVKKRKLADQAWESVAKKLNISPSDVQERMWDFEKRLYEKMGAIEKASYASEGFMKTAKKLEPGLDLDTPVVKSRSQKAFDENIKKEESDVKLKYNNNGQLLAPNGKPSNLNEDLARYTRTTVFKNWFGDWEKDSKNASKVVDENGEPLVVYHGSPYGGIKTFDRKESAKVSSGLKEFGTYFTTNRKVADIYASEGKISPEKINELNRQISKIQEAQDNTRNSSDYYNFEKEIEALKKNKSPKVYAAFLNLRSIKDFDAEQKSFPEAWRNLKVDAGYKTATDRDAMEFLREGKFGVKKVDGIKASDIVDIVSQGKKDNDFVGDVYLVFDSAPDAIRIAETPTVESRSQKAVPPVVDEVLTDDGKGNYLFVHYSRANRDVIKPMSGSKENFTSKEEVSAISSVGGLAMYYTKAGQKENGVGDVPHTVLVPKDKVYFYGTTDKGTVSHDPEGFEAEARRRFQEYKNRGNEKNPTVYAFDSNNAAAWVTKVAGENGYDMVITNWGGPKSYRAQTTKTLKAEDEYTGFKKPEPVVFEVGDEIFVSGSYGNVTAVNGSLVRYEGTNQYGGAVSGVFDTNRNNGAIMIEKAKPVVTTRAQKVEVKTIPGYDRMMNEVEGIMDKTMNRGGSYNQASANAINYLQKSAVYEKADDIQREQIVRDFKKVRGEKFKTAPSVAKIMGQIKDVKQVTVKESTALKDQIKLEAKAAKDSAAFVKQLRMDISGRLKSMVGRGMMSARQATAIISRYDKMNILNPVMRDRFVDYMSRVFQSAEYTDKIKEASKLRASIKKAMKSPANQAEIAKLAKHFGDIDPSRVENIDDYINNATQMLNAVARKTGDPLMRSLVNAEDMINYIDNEIQSQRKQIKEELLNKYKDLVDAGALSSKMTINEIEKVIAAIEENDNESVAKEEKAKAAVKEMMAEVSPFIVQIVKTGEDPFTGEPIVLTQDEKKSLIALTKMDTDSLSLSEAVQVLEYANNFVANGITSGIDGMVSLYQGGLNAGELVDDGIKSQVLSKNFSKAVGKVWGEGFGTLTMLNKLLWGNTRRAIMVSEKAGINGVANGKARALEMVDNAVKQYIKQFSKVKDFLSSENVVERGVFAFMSRNVIGDKFQAQDEFNRRKTLIEETIQALTDVDNNTESEIKKGEVIQKVYDKVLKVAKNINDVKKNVSQINQDAVRWWINKWSENFDRIDEVSRNVYNTELSRDIDFTPDRMQLKEAPTAVEEDFESGFFGNFEYVDTSKSGSLRKNNRIKTLPKDKNGVKTRIVNLDFDVNNVNALTSAMVDVETASYVMQLKGFVTSKNFSKLFSNKDDKNLYKKRLIKYVNRVKGDSYIDQNELSKVNRVINTIASFGVAKALFSVSQPFKQFFPPMINTFVQTGRFDLNKLLYNGGMSFIDKSGYPVANRGVASQGELKSINRKLVEAEKNLAIRGLDGIAEFSNKSLEITLKNPDIFAARASWLSFYFSELKKQGVNISGIDLRNHKLNKEAANYAQSMVDSQQNISDPDMQGEVFASKQPATVFLRRAILPLMTFTLNQKTRIWSDIRTLSNDVSSKDDKSEARRSLAGALVELAAFQGIALAFKELYNTVANAIMGEDEDEEEKKIRKMRQGQTTAQAFMKDFFLPPIPGMDIAASKGINYLLDETGLSDELPYKWYGIEDEEQKFRLYDKMNQGYLDMLGTQGIAAEKALELVDYYDAAIDGEFTKEYNGNKVKKALMEEDLDVARMNAVIMTAYYGGLLPSDMANIVNIMNKKIQKRAEQVEND